MLIAERGVNAFETRTGEEIGIIPDAVRLMIHRRLLPVSSTTRSVLTQAALIGYEFDLNMLEAISQFTFDALLASLEEAKAFKLIDEPGGSNRNYCFRHAMIRETLQGDINRSEVLQLHAKIAEELERLHGADLDSYLAEIAYHYSEALPLGTAEKVIDYATRGGHRAREQLAYGEAARLYRLSLKAFAASKDTNGLAHCKLLLALGETLMKGGGREEAGKRVSAKQPGECARTEEYRTVSTRRDACGSVGWDARIDR